MPITLLVSHNDHFLRTACLKDGNVIEIDVEWSSSKPSSFPILDQIYWGQVIQVEKTHAFIKLAKNEVGLLPFESHFPKPFIGQAILVQVRREAIPDKGTRHKGPLLTRNIFFGGRYCLFHPFQKKRFLSTKIQNPELRNHLQGLFPIDTPITLREAAIQASHANIQTEITLLQQKFFELESLVKEAPCRTSYDPMPSSYRWMRDLDALEGNMIVVDHEEALTYILRFLKIHRPDLLPFVKKHKDPLFKDYDLEEFWTSLFEEVIALPYGGNIVIDNTPAAIVIDVNQGQRSIQETNEQAIPVIVQQLKGRHLGGNVIIDFIGLDTSLQGLAKLKDLLDHQSSLYHLPLNIFGWSKLGWMEARLPKRRIPLKERLSLRYT